MHEARMTSFDSNFGSKKTGNMEQYLGQFVPKQKGTPAQTILHDHFEKPPLNTLRMACQNGAVLTPTRVVIAASIAAPKLLRLRMMSIAFYFRLGEFLLLNQHVNVI